MGVPLGTGAPREGAGRGGASARAFGCLLRGCPGTTYESTYINNFRIVGQGNGNNFLVHETYHVTVNANGEATAYVDNFRVECR